MNDRIRKLALQADEYAEQTVHYYMGQFDELTWEGKIKQTRDIKFAELIVAECVNFCNAHARDDGTAQKIATSLKQHFGVEE